VTAAADWADTRKPAPVLDVSPVTAGGAAPTPGAIRAQAPHLLRDEPRATADGLPPHALAELDTTAGALANLEAGDKRQISDRWWMRSAGQRAGGTNQSAQPYSGPQAGPQGDGCDGVRSARRHTETQHGCSMCRP